MFQNLRFPPTLLQSISLLKLDTTSIMYSFQETLLKRHYSSSLAHKVQIMESELQQRIKNAQITCINSLISSFSSKPRSLYSHLSHLKHSSSLPCILKHEDKTTIVTHLAKQNFLTTILIQFLLAVILFFHL